jgi:hypothetical protein
MRKLLIGLMFLACASWVSATDGTFRGYLKQSTATNVLVGPFTATANTGQLIALTVEDHDTNLVVFMADGVGAADIALHATGTANDLVMITTTTIDAWGNQELTVANTAQLGYLTLTWYDTGQNLINPITYVYQVVTADYWNTMFTASTIASTADVAVAVRDTALAVPTAGNSPNAPTLAEAISWLYSRWFNKSVTTATEYQLFKRDETDKIYEQKFSDSGSELTIGEAKEAD